MENLQLSFQVLQACVWFAKSSTKEGKDTLIYTLIFFIGKILQTSMRFCRYKNQKTVLFDRTLFLITCFTFISLASQPEYSIGVSMFLQGILFGQYISTYIAEINQIQKAIVALVVVVVVVYETINSPNNDSVINIIELVMLMVMFNTIFYKIKEQRTPIKVNVNKTFDSQEELYNNIDTLPRPDIQGNIDIGVNIFPHIHRNPSNEKKSSGEHNRQNAFYEIKCPNFSQAEEVPEKSNTERPPQINVVDQNQILEHRLTFGYQPGNSPFLSGILPEKEQRSIYLNPNKSEGNNNQRSQRIEDRSAFQRFQSEQPEQRSILISNLQENQASEGAHNISSQFGDIKYVSQSVYQNAKDKMYEDIQNTQKAKEHIKKAKELTITHSQKLLQIISCGIQMMEIVKDTKQGEKATRKMIKLTRNLMWRSYYMICELLATLEVFPQNSTFCNKKINCMEVISDLNMLFADEMKLRKIQFSIKMIPETLDSIAFIDKQRQMQVFLIILEHTLNKTASGGSIEVLITESDQPGHCTVSIKQIEENFVNEVQNFQEQGDLVPMLQLSEQSIDTSGSIREICSKVAPLMTSEGANKFKVSRHSQGIEISFNLEKMGKKVQSQTIPDNQLRMLDLDISHSIETPIQHVRRSKTPFISQSNRCTCRRILIYDAEVYNQIVLEYLLQKHSITANKYQDEKQVLDHINGCFSFDCQLRAIFINIHPTGKNKTPFHQQVLKAVSSRSQIPALALYTDHLQVPMEESCQYDFLDKPFRKRNLDILLRKYQIIV